MLLQSTNKYANIYLSVEKTQQRGGAIVMFDYKKLRGKIREVFGTEKQFAKALGAYGGGQRPLVRWSSGRCAV